MVVALQYTGNSQKQRVYYTAYDKKFDAKSYIRYVYQSGSILHRHFYRLHKNLRNCQE